jgi:glutamine transport system substrate-binding protein
MKSIIIGIFFIFISLELLALQSDVIKVATDTTFPPFILVKEGRLVGFDIDLLNLVASKLKKTIKFMPMEFNYVISSVASGITDLGAGGLSITEDREKIVDFTTPYFDSGFVIVTRKDLGNLDINQLEHKKVGTYISDITRPIVKTLKLDKNILFGKYNFLFDELISGSIDAIFVDYPFAQYMLSNKYKETLKITSSLYFQNQYGFAVRKNYPLKKDINKAIEDILLSPTYKTIYIKWIKD